MYALESIDQELKEIINRFELFDNYRLVDYKSYEVYDYQKGEFVKNNQYCYEIWNRGGPCENCTSRQAGINQCEMFKLEFLDGKLYLIISYPIQISSRNFILELIKDVTQSLTIRSIDEGGKKIAELINSLNDYVIHDTFTGLYNKKYAIQEIDKKLSLQKKLTLAMIDLDQFKNINDTYGHVKGDEVILYLADILKKYLVNTHVLASRIGGDEFMIVLDDVSEHDVWIICHEITEAVLKHPFYKSNQKFYVDISIGIAYSQDGDTAMTLIDKADVAMYKIKRQKASQK